MTEEERLIVIDRINDDKELLKLRNEKKDKKKELGKSDIVKEYLKISSEITKLNKKLIMFSDEKSMIELEFIWAFYTKIKGDGFLPCNHDIWLYCGSYSFWEDLRCGREHECLITDENNEEFSYNKYKCLECGKNIQVENYQEFEKNNFVLKVKNRIDAEKYIYLYYRFLYDYPVEEARKKLIEKFNDDNNSAKKKILEKN